MHGSRCRRPRTPTSRRIAPTISWPVGFFCSCPARPCELSTGHTTASTVATTTYARSTSRWLRRSAKNAPASAGKANNSMRWKLLTAEPKSKVQDKEDGYQPPVLDESDAHRPERTQNAQPSLRHGSVRDQTCHHEHKDQVTGRDVQAKVTASDILYFRDRRAEQHRGQGQTTRIPGTRGRGRPAPGRGTPGVRGRR